VAAAPPPVRAPRPAPRPASRGAETRIGLIGAGNFAKAFLLPAFTAQPGVRLQVVCTASGVSAAAVAKKYGAAATSRAEEVIDDPAVDLVMIATRHDTHADYAVRALDAGKAVYVEKPLALTEADLERIRTAYDTQSALGRQPFLMVGYNRRFSPLAVSLRAVFSACDEPLAMVYRVNAGAIPASEWVQDARVGGGRVIGECCHFVDFLSFVAGSRPVDIAGSALAVASSATSDNVTVTMRFENGSIGTIHYLANGHPSLPKEFVEVFGGGAAAQLLNFRSLTVAGPRPPGRTRYFAQVKGFEQEAAAVIAAARAGRAAPIAFDDLCRTSLATLRVEQALASGRRVEL
jgi:predicted dehydrogenase